MSKRRRTKSSKSNPRRQSRTALRKAARAKLGRGTSPSPKKPVPRIFTIGPSDCDCPLCQLEAKGDYTQEELDQAWAAVKGSGAKTMSGAEVQARYEATNEELKRRGQFVRDIDKLDDVALGKFMRNMLAVQEDLFGPDVAQA